jgi:hypothetical protein
MPTRRHTGTHRAADPANRVNHSDHGGHRAGLAAALVVAGTAIAAAPAVPAAAAGTVPTAPAAAGAMPTAPAAAGAMPTAPAAAGAMRAGSSLVLTVRVSGARPQVVTLSCSPARGSHPRPSEACRAVNAAHGDFTALKGREGVMCTMQFQPATAEAKGTWRGHPVRYRKTFSNACVLAVSTGPVFGF